MHSILAVVIILLSAILGGTLATNNTVPFLTDGYRNLTWNLNHDLASWISIGLGAALLIAGFVMRRGEFNDTKRIFKEMITAFVFSFTFASGIMIAGLSRRMNVIHGFSVFSQWTPIIFITFGVGMLLSIIFFLAVSST